MSETKDLKDKDYDEKEEGDDRDVERVTSRQGSSEQSETLCFSSSDLNFNNFVIETIQFVSSIAILGWVSTRKQGPPE